MLNLAERGELLSLPDGRFGRISGHFWRKKKWKTPNNSARASHFFVYFFYIHCTTTTWNVLMPGLMDWRTSTNDDDFFSLFFFINLDESFSIQLPKKFARTHWARLNKRDRVLKNQKSFLREFFTAVVVEVANKLPDNPIIDIAALMTQLAI